MLINQGIIKVFKTILLVFFTLYSLKDSLKHSQQNGYSAILVNKKKQINLNVSVVIEYALNEERYVQSLLTPELDYYEEVETVMAVFRDISLLKRRKQKKDGFISMVVNELKTPVPSLKCMIQLPQRSIKASKYEDALVIKHRSHMAYFII